MAVMMMCQGSTGGHGQRKATEEEDRTTTLTYALSVTKQDIGLKAVWRESTNL